MSHEIETLYIRNYELKVKRVKLAEPHAVYGRAIHDPDDVVSIAHALIGDSAQEHFIVLLLDIKNRVTGFTEAGRGGIDQCLVDLGIPLLDHVIVSGEDSLSMAAQGMMPS